jgi:hypothetical protein
MFLHELKQDTQQGNALVSILLLQLGRSLLSEADSVCCCYR